MLRRIDGYADAGGELHEFSDRAYAHLGHHSGSVHFHRLFAGAELGGNLLVEDGRPTCSITWRSRGVSASMRCSIILSIACAWRRSRSTRSASSTAAKMRASPLGLGQIVDGPRLHGARAGFHIVHAGEKGRSGARSPNAAARSADRVRSSRTYRCQQHAARRRGILLGEKTLRRFERAHLIARRP